MGIRQVGSEDNPSFQINEDFGKDLADYLVDSLLGRLLDNPLVLIIVILIIIGLVLWILSFVFKIRAKHKEAQFYSSQKKVRERSKNKPKSR